MPELPEVEVVRRGLAAHVLGRTIDHVDLRGHRVARRHLPGPTDLADRLRGTHVEQVRRRGKYLWLILTAPASSHDFGLVLHLGMSGQLLVEAAEAPDEKHLHARFTFADQGPELRFVDQRTFGGLALADLDHDGFPTSLRHLAPDLLEVAFDRASTVRRIRASDSAIKRVLLDQRVASGIGNIYADEALWRARLHGERPASSLSSRKVGELLDHASEVMTAALQEGGTSFDALYVDVNGASGYFDRSLAAYGQTGRPCRRCGTAIRREAFMNRSSFSCPRCQRR